MEELKEEMKKEMKKEDLKKVIGKIAEVHPYEEPAVDVIPMIAWKEFIPSDDR